jgi:hypothetical protein
MKPGMKKVLLLITLPFVLWLFYSHSAYWHFHITPAGVVVEHSHPFKSNTTPGTPFQKHSHTEFEYSVLAQFSSTTSIVIFLLVLSFLLLSPSVTTCFYRGNLHHVSRLRANFLRGPPVMV